MIHQIVDVVSKFDANKSAGDDHIMPVTVERIIASNREKTC